MLIGKFNKLIRNKFVWAIFAILVSLAMVGLFAPQPRDGREQRRGDGLGTLFGEDISREDFVRARMFVQSFQPIRGGEEVQRMVDEEAWGRLAAVRYAEKLGLRVSRSDLVEMIQRDPSFQENGIFNMQRYQFLVEQQLGVPVAWFEEYIRQEILLDRMRELLGASLWIPASELEENAARFTDSYEVAFVLIAPDEDLEVADVAEEEARKVYAESPHLFMVPEQRRVVYVAIGHADHVDPEQISARQIEARYDADPSRFTYTDLETDIVLTQPLGDVADEIRMELAEQEAIALASEHAMRLVDELSLAEASAGMNLETIAGQLGLNVATSDWFQARGPVPDAISAGPAFLQSAFRLSSTDPAQSFSFSIPGTNAVYVMQLHDVAEEYLPGFEEVQSDALAVAREFAEEEAFQAHVQAVHTRIMTALREGQSFGDAVAREGLQVTEMKPFTLFDADPREIPFFGDLAPDLLPLQTGELTPPIDTVEGKVIAYVKLREVGALEERLAIKPDLTRMMTSGLENVHFNAWVAAILEEARK